MTRFQLLVLAICGMATTILGCEPQSEPQSRETREVESPAGVPIRFVASGNFGGVYLTVIRDEERGVTCYTRGIDTLSCVSDAVRPAVEVDAGGR